MWSDGMVRAASGTVYEYQVKHYDEGSRFGINGGRVSKLWIAARGGVIGRKVVVSYDRGWDIKPEDGSEAYEVMQDLLRKYN